MRGLKDLHAGRAFWTTNNVVRIWLYLDENFKFSAPDHYIVPNFTDRCMVTTEGFDIALMGQTLTVSDGAVEITFPPFAAPYVSAEVGLESRVVFADTHSGWVTARGLKSRTDHFQPLTEIEIFRMTRGY